ncbi:MAG: NTP transferase domain-containing protein [Lachnospiraceae bacterium]|nr:NTP transferase domain-containing protein [Lachnospiraceae bacterium]
MKGIILAGGSGTRLYPLTKVISKQLLPVYDKPMVMYPLATLLQAGIREILIITTPVDLNRFKGLIGEEIEVCEGDKAHICYASQEKANGIAEAFIIGKEFVGKDSVALILGDNFFYGESFKDTVKSAVDRFNQNGLSTIFGIKCKNPKAYGVIEFNSEGQVLSVEEKPEKPKSSYAVPGLYFYSNEVIKLAENLKPSARGEIEITDINNEYIKLGKLHVELLPEGTVWMDMGTPELLLAAANFVAEKKNDGTEVGNFKCHR